MLLVGFGRHGKRSVEQLFFVDPGYVNWMIENGIHHDPKKFNSAEQKRFDDLIRRASNLKIPGPCPWCKKLPVTRMFMTIHISGGLACVGFDCNRCEYDGGSKSIPVKPSFLQSEIFRRYDKTGGKILVEAIKYAYFKDKSYKMTKDRADEFFDTPTNFLVF